MSAITEESASISARYGHSRCLLCGNLNPRSLNLSFKDSGDGGVTAQFKARNELQGYDDILHGGVIAALLDAGMTHCLFHHGVQAVTGDLHVRYIKSISCNADLDIQAWMSSSHPPFHLLMAEIMHDGQVMARAEAKFMEHRKVQ